MLPVGPRGLANAVLLGAHRHQFAGSAVAG
jgi:hypothetical protein